MWRCIRLAKSGLGAVAPNPMVGAVLVHEDRIIGEGYHQKYGQAHAEVNCINSVNPQDESLISKSTMYVSLEPCAHYGKTPPCADLIIQKKIPRVVIGCRDPFTEVNGKGIEKLQAAGIEVIQGILEDECKTLNKRFFTFHIQRRPYIILKWAQSKNEKIAGPDFERISISNSFTNKLVHKWRSEEAGIMIGTNTALHDNPSLTTRLWKGQNPVRIVLDMSLRIPQTHNIFDNTVKTIVFNIQQECIHENIIYYKISGKENIIQQIAKALHQSQIQSVIIEGGTHLLQSCINEGCWDEARVITNEDLTINNGIPAPQLLNACQVKTITLLSNKINLYQNNKLF